MPTTTEQLRERAHELALQQQIKSAAGRSGYIKRQIETDTSSIRAFVALLQDAPVGCGQQAEEWLLDNAEFIEEQVLNVKLHLSESALIHVPRLRGEERLRIHALCLAYLEQVDGILDERTLLAFLNAYQEISALTLVETRLIPVMLKVSLIGKIAETMALVRERREVCSQVQQLLKQIEPARLNAETIGTALEQAGQIQPLSGPWAAHLISHLREWSGDSAAVREWLVCTYENGSDDLDRIVTYEAKLQVVYQVKAGNLITSLRSNERRNWEELFEEISLLDRTMREDVTGLYPRLDTSSRNGILNRIAEIARRLRVPESLVAAQSLALAKDAYEHGSANPLRIENKATGEEQPQEELGRQAFAAYYVFEPAGVTRLIQALKKCSQPRTMPLKGLVRSAPTNYFSSWLALFMLLLVAAAAWVIDWNTLSTAGLAAVILALLFPISEWVMTGLNFGIERICRVKPLLRFDYSSGIEAEAATMVVIPAIWSTVQEVEELADRLEIHYLGNRDPNIHYALLGDFADAREESLPSDELLIAAVKARIDRLNRMYGDSGTTFHYYQRSRQWNSGEGVFMGWERKRGKLVEFVNLLRGSGETSYTVTHGDRKVLPDIRYIITLDADTQLPIGSAQRLIGTLHFPYNRPRLNKAGSRVVEGYGVLQPRIGTSHESAMRSRLAHFWSDPGIDPYAFTVSDPYQDAFGTGIFTGKGIFDVNVFAQLLGERIPDNTVLSHDLLEGGFLRAALVSDIELIEEHPSTFLSFQKRMHRWVRGDWQLLCWLRTSLCDRRGDLRPIDLSLLTRWQIIDNLRRSLLPIAMFVLFALAVTVLPGYPARWLAFLFLTLLLPLIRQLAIMNSAGTQPKHVLSTLVMAGIGFWTLPFQTAVLLDAIVKTLYRMTISKRRMLEWTSFSQTERSQAQAQRRMMILGGRGGFLLILLFAAVVVLQPISALLWFGLALCLFWGIAPVAVRWLDQPVLKPERPLEAADAERMRILAKEIWQFYEDFAGKEDHFLPPDNVQIEPANGVAHRTSPTNIGFLLTAALAARELDFITTPMLVERLERTVGVIERMEKWNGHLYNWYDTSTLDLLRPAYVSTVDSGNFVASLMTVKQGLIRWLQKDGWGKGSRRRGQAQLAAVGTEFAVELDRTHPEEIYGARQAAPPVKPDEPTHATTGWIVNGYELVDRLERLIVSTDFGQLYDDKARLFVLGYHADSGQKETILYDLLASEARQTSFVAIALGQISVSHWLALGRTAKLQGGHATLISWSGTMFEYMMPWLIMRTYPGTVWDSTYRGVVQRQIAYATGRSVPFGISESGYYAYDYQLNYQYRAFGVPGLGFKRGLEEDTVIAPYATIMALPFALREGLQNLERLDQLGMRGEYGYYEAIDFTAHRMPQGESHKIIRSFMAHHQGMSLLTLANMLVPSCMINYFHADKRVQAAELLLIERIPQKSALLNRELPGRSRSGGETKLPQNDPLREFAEVPAPLPEANVHGNGSLTTVLTETGSGFIRYNGLDLTRWREDPVMDPWGSFIYVRDVEKNVSWSPTYLPCRKKAERVSVQFRKERTTFLREDDGLQTKLEVTVSTEHNAEVRRLTLTNTTQEARIIEITTYMELAMAAHNADKAHPSFTKLFVQTEFASEAQCLLARKRPRNDDETPLWAFHTLRVDEEQGAAEFETDRAAFIGRGHTLANPRGLTARLGGTFGAVADPAFIMRKRVHVEPGKQISLTAVTGAAESKKQALEIISQLSSAEQAERTFQMAWTRSQIDLQHLRISEQDASAYQLLAGRILFASPLRPEQEASISANRKGQPGLWAHGVSGDRPIALVSVSETSSLPFMNKLLVGYEYLRRKGISFDLVIWNESSGGYQQELREALLRMIEQNVHNVNNGAGVHIVAASEQSDEDKFLLFAAARLLLHAEGPSLRAQLLPRESGSEQLPELVPIAPPNLYSDKPSRDEGEGLFFNGYGSFSADGSEYRIVLRNGQHLPAPWINVVANENFGFLASELYTGQTWWSNSRECKLTPWSNDPALDPPGEAVYIRDEGSGEYWGLTPSRKLDSKTVYTVSHGQGYSRYEHESHGLSHEMTVFVPLNDPVKIIRLRLTNDTSDVRKLSVTYYAEWVIGVNREENASNIVTEWDPEHHVLLARNTYQETFRKATPFLAMHPRTLEASQSWTGSRLSFIGRDGDLEDPAAMRKTHLSGETGPVHDACGAIQGVVSLEPGEEGVVYILLGCGDSRDSSTRLAQKYSEADACEQAYQDARAFWKDINGTIQVATPSAEMDIMLNNWLLYQSLSCRMWARTAFYQAGGAFGFRDQLQDSLSMLHVRPEMTRAQIIRHASHQYREGDVQHWWHEETHRGIRTRFSDDLLWLPYAVVRYMEQTEDESILTETAPFLQSELLKEDEHERYEETVLSEENGTILEHCFRAIDRALRFGEHGLPLMGIGDWNDGMSNIGPLGRGESVWLGWFLGEVLSGIAGICERYGEPSRAERYLSARSKLAKDMQEAAWDGNWYRRAFTDSGEWLGSVRNAECRIDAIAQSWSVISGMAPKERALQAMHSFDRELVDRHLAIAHILTPPFDKTKPSPGYIQAYPPGIRENGGQYTHGVIWSIVAWSILGDGNKAFELFHMFNPITHTKSSFDARTYVGEPYAMSADVYTEQPHRGHAGWTWYTGAAGWMYQAGIEWIVGLKRRGEKLLIQPCIPAEWPEFTVTYTYKHTAYRIIVRNPSRKSGGCTALRIDGKETELSMNLMGEIPFITLEDDQLEHVVELTL